MSAWLEAILVKVILGLLDKLRVASINAIYASTIEKAAQHRIEERKVIIDLIEIERKKPLKGKESDALLIEYHRRLRSLDK